MERENELETNKKQSNYSSNVYTAAGPNSLKEELLREKEKAKNGFINNENKEILDRIYSYQMGQKASQKKEEIEVLGDDEEEVFTPRHAYSISCAKENDEKKIEVKEQPKEEIKVPVSIRVEEKIKAMEEKENQEKITEQKPIAEKKEVAQIKEIKKEEKKEEVNTNIDTKYSKVLNYDKADCSNKEVIKEEKRSKKSKKEKSKKEKKPKKKMKLWEKIFCGVSALFILGCCGYYGTRLVKYYKIYNPVSESGEKIELLSTSIAKGSSIVYEGSGLYMVGGSYTYKGTDVNNYIKFSNQIWRIVRSNKDGSLDVVLDQSINTLKWDNELKNYTDSDVHKYLNTKFLETLNKDLLVPTTSCNDIVDDVKSFSCKEYTTDSYVRLLTMSDYLNSDAEGTYISDSDDKLWLSTRGTTFVWNVNGTNLSNSESTRTYDIKPVVTLKNTAAVLKGDGTKENPYQVEEDKKELAIGSYVKLGNDTWVVYSKENGKVRLALNNLYNEGTTTYRFSVNTTEYNPLEENSLAYYLNNTFYDTLSYKDLLQEVDWYIGGYESSYQDVYTTTVKAKVGSYNVADLKFNSELTGYYLLTPASESEVYVKNDELMPSKVAMYRGIRPTICIETKNIKSGEGTEEAPYELEV